MSRIGKMPIIIPEGVDLTISDNKVSIKGPKGTITKTFHSEIFIKVVDRKIFVERKKDEKFYKSLHGLTRSLLANMINGVTQGFQKTLVIVGTGYRATKVGQGIQIQIGYSHPVMVNPPTGITLEVEGTNKILVKGIDKELVGQVAANIRAIKEPLPYKGKGIRYEDEEVKLKAGKAGKVGKK